jgi:hypothetical protein
MPSQEDPKL